MKRTLPLVLAALFLFSFSACSKKGEQGAGEGALGGKLVQNVPATALFFFTTSTATESYQALRKSPLYSAGTQLSGTVEDVLHAAGIGEAEATGPEAAMKALRDAGIVPGGKTDAGLFEEVVVFGDVEEGRIVLAVAASAAPGKDLQPALRSVVDALQKADVEIKDEAFGGINGYRLKVKEPAEDAFFQYAYAAASQSQMMLSTSKSILKSFFDGSARKGLPDLKTRPLFQEAMKGMPSLARSYSFGFLDMEKFKEAAASVPSLQNSVTEMKNLPVDSSAFSSAFEGSLLTDVSVVTRPKTPEDRKWLEPLAVRSSQTLIGKAPASLFFSLGVDGQIFKKLADAAKESAQGTQGGQSMLPDENVPDMKELMLGMRMNETGSPFPDILVAADTPEAGAITKSLEETLGGLAAMTGMPVSQWSEKKLGKATVRFINSPMGIGVYLTALNNIALLGTAEGVVADMVKSTEGSAPVFSTRLSPRNLDYIKREQPGIFLYIDFPRVASVLDTFQGTLAAFSGGNSAVDRAQIESLKKMGTFSLGGSWQEPLLKVHTELAPPEG